MELSEILFLCLLGAVALSRAAELRISRRNQRSLQEQNCQQAPDPRFPAMVALHAAVLCGAGAEVIWLGRPFLMGLAGFAGIAFLSATAVRWWAIRSLGAHWNVRVMDSAGMGVVSSGPYRWIRHPNYAAVFVEMVALPLIHSAWMTAITAAAGNWLVLHSRVRAEERVLNSHPEYELVMAGKPRFIPRFFEWN